MFAKMKNQFARFGRDEDGATLVEYGIALGLAITVGASTLIALSNDVSASMSGAQDALPCSNVAGVDGNPDTADCGS